MDPHGRWAVLEKQGLRPRLSTRSRANQRGEGLAYWTIAHSGARGVIKEIAIDINQANRGETRSFSLTTDGTDKHT